MKYKQCYFFQEFLNSMYLNLTRNLMYLTKGTVPKFYRSNESNQSLSQKLVREP